MNREEIIKVLEDLKMEIAKDPYNCAPKYIDKKRYEALTYAISLIETWSKMLDK